MRGLLLFLVVQGLGRNERKFSRIGIGGLVVTVLFGVGHGLAIQNGELVYSLVAIVITGAIGLGLLWIRERTGSVVLPIVAHNIINTALTFF